MPAPRRSFDQAPPSASEVARRERLRRRNRWAIFALVFPLIFTAVIATGLLFMWRQHMSVFKPAPSGSAAMLRAPA